MKKYLLHFVVIISFIACEKEQALTPNPSFDPTGTKSNTVNTNPTQLISTNKLVGTWEMSSLDYTGTSTNAGITASFVGIGKDFTYEITFNDNPKTFVATGGYTVDLTTTIDSSTITQESTIPDAGSNGTWSLSGNTLTVTDSTSGQSQSTQILQGSNNSFSYDFAGMFGQSAGGADVSFSSGQVSYTRK